MKKNVPKAKNTAPKSSSQHGTVKNKPKTGANIPYNVVRDTSVLMKRQAIKKKSELAEITRQEQSTEQPENYAVSEIESAAYKTAGTAHTVNRRLTGKATRQLVNTRKEKQRNDIKSTEFKELISESDARTPKTANNTPKTADSVKDTNVSKRTDNGIKPKSAQRTKTIKTADKSPKIKTRDVQPIRTAESVIKNTEIVSETPERIKKKSSVIKPKTKEVCSAEKTIQGGDTHYSKIPTRAASKRNPESHNYIGHQTEYSTPQRETLIENPVSREPPKIKTKENYLKRQNSMPEAKSRPYNSTKQKYYMNKVKKNPNAVHTGEIDGNAYNADIRLNQQNPNNISAVHESNKQNSISAEVKFKSSANTADISKSGMSDNKSNVIKSERHDVKTDTVSKKALPDTSDISSKKKIPDIKTKESYMQSLRSKYSEPLKVPRKKDITPKQKQNIITRNVKTNSPAEANKIYVNTVKRGRSTFKASRTFKTKKAVKTVGKAAAKAQKQVTKQAAKQAAKRSRELARHSAQAAKTAARTAVRLTIKAAQAIAAAAKAAVSAIAAAGPVAVVIVILIVIIIIAAIAASPFGIFISDEVSDSGSIPLSQIIAEYNVELTQETEDIELSVEHTEVEVIDNRTDNNTVIAVFAAKTAGAEDDTAEDVVIFDEAKAEKLKGFFRNANTVDYEIEETVISSGSDDEEDTVEISLTITITGKTKNELEDEYELTAKQREAVETLLENTDTLSAASHSLAVTDADVQSIVNGLPDSLSQKRKDVVKNAASLVGKVNYFWGGKSSAIGWDSAWGTMRRVTASGSPSSGTIRAYGLDCSGFVSWVFNNSGMYVGDGTYGQRDNSVVVSQSAVQAGDLCFLSSYSHVGIVVGKDTSGNILVIHCSSSANNVVLSIASGVGFTVFRRPNCY